MQLLQTRIWVGVQGDVSSWPAVHVGQAMQELCPVLCWYCPEAHSVQTRSWVWMQADDSLLPAAHVVHEEQPPLPALVL